MDLAAKRVELLRAQEQLLAQLNFVHGQLALLEALEAEAAAAALEGEEPPPPSTLATPPDGHGGSC